MADKPTIGRVVIYTFHDSETTSNNNSSEAPAVIVRVWSDECVNLKVLNDGADNTWKTSILRGEGQGTWHWPIRASTDVPPPQPPPTHA